MADEPIDDGFPGTTPEALREWLARSMAGRPLVCQVCGEDSWVALDNYYELVVFRGAGKTRRPPGRSRVVPLLVLMCNNCSHSLLINALASGILKLAPEDTKGADRAS